MKTLTFTSHYSYNAAGDITESIDNAGNVIKYEYDDNGNQTASIDAKGGRITYAYDAVGNVTEQTSTSGAKTTYVYDERNRNTSITDALGNVTSFAYDEAARLTSRTDAKGVTLAKYSYGLGKAGERLTITESAGASEMETTYQYDKLNRLVKEVIAKDGNKLTNQRKFSKADRQLAMCFGRRMDRRRLLKMFR